MIVQKAASQLTRAQTAKNLAATMTVFVFAIVALSVSVESVAATLSTAPAGLPPAAPKKPLEKTPKSLFLVKKIKISPDVGEPQFNPQDAQLRTVINDPALHNTKKFE